MTKLPSSTTALFAVFAVLASSVNALQYYIGNPAQCQPLNLTWSDAKGALHLLIVPTAETSQGFIQNITLPTDATSPYTFTNFTQPAGMAFMAVMWDDEGYAGTGVTDILTVGSSDNSTCLRGPGSILPDFFFYTSTENPGQCSNVDITWQPTYTPPTYIVGMIPGGDIWDIHSVTTSGVTSYTWRVDVKEGTRMLLTMPDAGPIGTGGSTSLWTITGGSASCLTAGGPASITASATQSGGSSATPSVSGIGGGGGRPGSTSSAGQAGNGGSGSKSSNIGAIVGGVVGGVAGLVILALLAFCLLRRRKRQAKNTRQQGMYITPGGGGGAVKGSSGGGGVGGIFDRGRRNTQADIDLLGPGEAGRTSEEFLHQGGHSNDDSPGSYEPQPYLTGFQYANTTTTAPGPGSSGFAGTRTSHESQLISDTVGSRSRPHSYGISDFGNFASSESDGAIANPYYPSGMSSVSGPVTGASPQLPGSPSLPIASMYPSPNSPSAPLMESSNMGPAGTGARSNSTRKRRPAAPVGPDGRPATRFVLHQDAGEIEDPGPEQAVEGDVVEMPPRYDQLRPGAKASVENLGT